VNPAQPRLRRGIPLRTIVPNAITALALCSGLFAIRFGIDQNWTYAAGAVLLSAVLDGLDGRIARLLNGQSRFGAELDSLSDVTAFGVAPAIVMYLWVLHSLEPGTLLYTSWVKYGWLAALSHAACCALRLARFNASIDVRDQPHKSAGFLTGVPAPAGAGLLFLPLFIYLATGQELFRHPLVVAPWSVLVALLMISSLATFSWGSIRLRSGVRLGALLIIALVGGALLSDPWPTLSIVTLVYALLIPLSIYSYSRIKRQRTAARTAAPPVPDLDA
jgi:CDP-diacylglycerol---serine O-phosphatidyltransferase